MLNFSSFTKFFWELYLLVFNIWLCLFVLSHITDCGYLTIYHYIVLVRTAEISLFTLWIVYVVVLLCALDDQSVALLEEFTADPEPLVSQSCQVALSMLEFERSGQSFEVITIEYMHILLQCLLTRPFFSWLQFLFMRTPTVH